MVVWCVKHPVSRSVCRCWRSWHVHPGTKVAACPYQPSAFVTGGKEWPPDAGCVHPARSAEPPVSHATGTGHPCLRAALAVLVSSCPISLSTERRLMSHYAEDRVSCLWYFIFALSFLSVCLSSLCYLFVFPLAPLRGIFPRSLPISVFWCLSSGICFFFLSFLFFVICNFPYLLIFLLVAWLACVLYKCV